MQYYVAFLYLNLTIMIFMYALYLGESYQSEKVGCLGGGGGGM